jgi:hypothetical protein
VAYGVWLMQEQRNGSHSGRARARGHKADSGNAGGESGTRRRTGGVALRWPFGWGESTERLDCKRREAERREGDETRGDET